MNVLEKILKEIENHAIEFESFGMCDDYVSVGWVKEIIRSHINGATDTDMGDKDDTEEKIREHIAECLHRIDNIRSFVGSKKYTNNDEKCIRNIEVLKTSITALEEYLSSKKKNGNDGWIPVEDGLPEEGKEVLAQFVVRVVHTNNTVDEEVYIHPLYYENGVWQSFAGVPNGKVEAWCPLPKPYKPKKLQTEEKPVQ